MFGIGETEGQGWVSLTFGLMKISPMMPMLGVLRLEEGGGRWGDSRVDLCCRQGECRQDPAEGVGHCCYMLDWN